jgi:hypothetical protein
MRYLRKDLEKEKSLQLLTHRGQRPLLSIKELKGRNSSISGNGQR